jgi:uncharacterized MAPEG superfamily protein
MVIYVDHSRGSPMVYQVDDTRHDRRVAEMTTPIPTELALLIGAVAVGVIQLHWAALAARRQQSFQWGASARDEPRPLTGVPARLERAYANFMETFPLFAVAVLTAHATSKLGPLTLWGSLIYVVARTLYVPLYAAGVPYARTLVWQAALIGLLLVISALFG